MHYHVLRIFEGASLNGVYVLHTQPFEDCTNLYLVAIGKNRSRQDYGQFYGAVASIDATALDENTWLFEVDQSETDLRSELRDCLGAEDDFTVTKLNVKKTPATLAVKFL